MRYLILFTLLLTPSLCSGANKVFYDVNTNKEIIDVSGAKTVQQIEKEFGVNSVIEVTVNKGEGYRIVNDTIEKYDIKKENGDIAKAEEAIRKDKEDRIKQKLNLTTAEFKELKEALGK